MTVQPLLAGHRDSEALLGADSVLLALGGLGGVDLHPADPSVELIAGGVMVVRDRRAGVRSDVGRAQATRASPNSGDVLAGVRGDTRCHPTGV